MNKVIKRFENMMFSSLLMVFFNVLVGLVLIFFNDFSTKINYVIVGSFILVNGLFYIIRYLYDGLGNKFFAIDLITGVISVLLGIFTFINLKYRLLETDDFVLTIDKVMGIVFGIWLIVGFIEKIFYGIKFMKVNEEIFPLITFISVLFLVMGVIVIFNPFKAFMLISRLIGLFMVCAGLFESMVCMLFRRRAKNILKVFE